MRRALGSLPLLFAAQVLTPASAWAWPVDVYVDLEAGGIRFERLAAISWVEVEDPSVATVEVLPTREVLLTGVKPGRTLALFYAEGHFGVWRLRVSPPCEVERGRREGAVVVRSGSDGCARPNPASGGEALTAAERACPGLRTGPAEAPSITATVRDERCRQALLALFQTDAFSARQLELTFELPALQAQLADLELGLRQVAGARVKAVYRGAGLSLEGTLSAEEHRRALWEVFRRSAARVALEDRIDIAPDAGVASRSSDPSSPESP